MSVFIILAMATEQAQKTMIRPVAKQAAANGPTERANMPLNQPTSR